MKKLLGALLLAFVMSFLGSSGAMAQNLGVLPAAVQKDDDKDGDKDKDPKRKRHHKHHHRRHHKHEDKDKDKDKDDKK
jgi:Ni/Co efflux regulator RcnB